MNNLMLNRESGFVWAAAGALLVAGCSALFYVFAAPGTRRVPIPDSVDLASQDSFPASDPPSTW